MAIRTFGGRFSEAFKLHVIEEVESGRLTQSEARRKYGILGHSTIEKWFRKYGSLRYSSAKGKTFMSNDAHDKLRLENEIKALKQELEDARLKNVVMETFLDIAEKELGIPIRKKYGAKQSEKSK